MNKAGSYTYIFNKDIVAAAYWLPSDNGFRLFWKFLSMAEFIKAIDALK